MKTGSFHTLTVGIGGNDVLVSSAPHRTAIRVSAPTFGRVTISPNSPVSDGGGFVLEAGMQPLYLCEDCVGHLIEVNWFVVADQVGRIIGVTEVF